MCLRTLHLRTESDNSRVRNLTVGTLALFFSFCKQYIQGVRIVHLRKLF